MKQIAIAGVGGQGIILASRVLARTAIDEGLDVKTAETIGMAQRGGSVVSHVRIAGSTGEKIWSPMIPSHQADVLIAFEVGEALRNISFASPATAVVVSDMVVFPTTTTGDEVKYDTDAVLADLRHMAETGQIASLVEVEASRICREVGSFKTLNMAMLGASAKSTGFSLEQLKRSLEQSVKPRFLEMNTKAMELAAQR